MGCGHFVGASQGANGVYLTVEGGSHSDIRFKHCPKCGEKLNTDEDAEWLRDMALTMSDNRVHRLAQGLSPPIFHPGYDARLIKIADRLEKLSCG